MPFFHYGYNEERLLDFAFYEDTMRYDAFDATVSPADVDLPGRARHVGGLPHRRAVRAHAPERHAVACSTTIISSIASLPRIWNDVEAFLGLIE